MSAQIQFLTDEQGNRTSAVIPIELYDRLVANMDGEEELEELPYVSGANDDEVIPHEVGKIHRRQKVPLHVAWRIYRGLSQQQVAEALDVSQAAISNLESRRKPQAKTLEKLSVIYNCRITQLYLD